MKKTISVTFKINLLILQYNINNDRIKTMISLFENKKVQKYDILTIQKLWRNFIVFTFYNSSKSKFHLAYNSEKKTRICFYINKRLNTNKWNVTFSSTNAISLKLKVMKNEIEKKIWIHNIYNFLSSFYSTIENKSTLSIIEKCVNEIETNHILLNDFNLHHSLWNESSKFTQHVMTNQLIDIINEADMKLILSQETITWEAKNFQSIIDLIFMSNELINKIEHCKTRLKINQLFDHISIFTKLLFKIVTTSIIFRKL